jgi:hypothetical protein
MDKKVVAFALFMALLCWIVARNGGGSGGGESVSERHVDVDIPEELRHPKEGADRTARQAGNDRLGHMVTA